MAVSRIVSPTNVTIDLDDPPTGHRLAELVQLLARCSIERAELAVSDPAPAGPATQSDALDRMAQALVRLRQAARGETGETEAEGPSGP